MAETNKVTVPLNVQISETLGKELARDLFRAMATFNQSMAEQFRAQAVACSQRAAELEQEVVHLKKVAKESAIDHR